MGLKYGRTKQTRIEKEMKPETKASRTKRALPIDKKVVAAIRAKNKKG